MGLSPAPKFPERGSPVFDESFGPNQAGGRGPLRFEEGIGTDTNVPSDFSEGMTEGMLGAPGRFNHVNPEVQFKHADQVLRERAHIGSAAWIDSPAMLGDFAHGTATQFAEDRYEEVVRSGGKQVRVSPSVVRD